MDEGIPNQNLVRQVKVGGRAPIQPDFYKSLIFDLLGVLSALGMGYAYSRYLVGQVGLGVLFLVLTVFAAISVLQMFLTKRLSRRFFVLILEAMAMSVFFSSYGLWVLLLAVVSIVLFILWGDALSHSELENRLGIQFFKVARPTLQKMTTAITLALVILYLPQLSQTRTIISVESFKSFFDDINGAVNNFYPEINLTSSVNDLAKSIAEQELQNAAAFSNLSPADKQIVLKQTTDQIVYNIGEQLGITVFGSETPSDLFYKFVNGTLNKWRDVSEYWFVIGWAIAIFIILRGFGAIFYWVVGLIAFLLYQILLAAGFMHIAGETRMHEILEF
jgi:hypothetical protein